MGIAVVFLYLFWEESQDIFNPSDLVERDNIKARWGQATVSLSVIFCIVCAF